MTTAERCNECAACKRVEAKKRHAMPNPPFRSASDRTVRLWNQLLANNPCERWSAEALTAFYQQLGGVSEAIRPHLPT